MFPKPLLNDPITWSAQELANHLFLFHIAKNLEQLTAYAARENLTHDTFLRHCLDTERAGRYEARVKRLTREAKFPAPKTIDAFDWAHPTAIAKSMILNALSLDFVERKEHLIFVGPGGVGKTHLAISLGFAACQKGIPTLFTTAADMINYLVAAQVDQSVGRALRKYTLPKLLVIDELGYLPLDKQGRDLFFQVISKRADTGSVILTTNKAFKDWGEVFQDNAVASAIAERLIEHGDLIKIEGSSYRVKTRKQKYMGLHTAAVKNEKSA
jgi:DNA replication protein DnaC